MLIQNYQNPSQKGYPVPGDIVIKLTPEGKSKVTRNIPPGPIRKLPEHLIPTQFGIDSIDALLKSMKCKGITKVHGTIPESSLQKNRATEDLAKEMGATYRIRFDNPKMSAEEVIEKLLALDEVADAASNNFVFAQATTPNDPRFGNQWGLTKIHCPDAWDSETGSHLIKIAVIDSGVDLNHPDLVGNLISGQDFVDLASYGVSAGDVIDLDGVAWRLEGDVLTPDNDPQDEVGHGTHVAGIAAAVTNNADGVAGVTWNCKIMPVRVLFRLVRVSDGLVIGVGTDADIAAGIRWAVDENVHIINLSLGGYDDNFVQRDAIQYAILQDTIVVAAMGNDNTSTPMYPAAYPDVISVGSVNQTENRSYFSNYGSHIDVVAPGEGIWSTYWNDTYAEKSGTSMAAPFVSGLAALILSCNPSYSGGPSVIATLQNSCKPLKDNPSDPVPNDKYGYGLINAYDAISYFKANKAMEKIQKELDKAPKDIEKFRDKLPKDLEKITDKHIKEFEKLPKEFDKKIEKQPKEFDKPYKEKDFEKPGEHHIPIGLKASDKVSDKTFDKTVKEVEKLPEKLPEKQFEKVPEKRWEKLPEKFPEKNPKEIPDKGPKEKDYEVPVDIFRTGAQAEEQKTELVQKLPDKQEQIDKMPEKSFMKDNKEKDTKDIKDFKDKDLKDNKEKDVKDNKEKDVKDTKECKEKDYKDSKEKDTKDVKEKDTKDIKDGKEKELKEAKEKDIKESKEKDFKDRKEKDFKEIEQKVQEIKYMENKAMENPVGTPPGNDPNVLAQTLNSINETLRRIQEMMAKGESFISKTERPDVGEKIVKAEKESK
jgi:subtilisin family serine protease